MRVGIGVDQHRFTPDRSLVLGGVEIPHDQGLEGHSDADALTHAICDALLGAAGLGDIGEHFPATDEAFRDISSLILLARVKEMIAEAGWRVENVDAVVVAEAPKLASYLDDMIHALAATLEIDASRLNLKATRPEGLGALGRHEGVYAHAVAGLVHLVDGDARSLG
ncbi:MAG: 2-C-methyl-D-erythritol 2,4-cyclodiphosphate synthase [Candidatus Bipolaricaulia bacterium]